MKISKKLIKAINEQINYELYSSYTYLSMATWFEEQNLEGMAHWMKVQAKEEYEHAMKFLNHVEKRGGRVLLKKIETPKTEWITPLEVWEDAYKHEMRITKEIYKIGEIAKKEGDKAVIPLLQWFYNEQVEEEQQTRKVRDLLKITNAPFTLDARLGRRE